MTIKSDLSKREDYVLIPLEQFITLNRIAKVNSKGVTMIKTEDLLFLSAVMTELSKQGLGEITVFDNTVTIRVTSGTDVVINSSFDISLCERYYNRVSKFIDEII